MQKVEDYNPVELGKIPDGWKLRKVKDVCHKIIKGIFDLSPTNYVPAGIPFLRISDIKNNIITTTNLKYISNDVNEKFPNSQLRPGDIVIAKVGSAGAEDKIAKVPNIIKSCNISQNLIGIKINQNELEPDYLLYFLQLPKTLHSILSCSNTTTLSSIQLGVLREIEMPLPEKLEQKKIVFILSKLDELIQKTNQITEQTQRIKKGLMQKLLTKGIGHNKFKKTSIGEIPEEWQTSTIGNECKVGSGGTPSRRKPENFKGNIPWVRTTELNYNLITKTDEMITESALKDSNLKLYPKGTFLVAMIGLEAEGTRGKCALLGINAAVNQNCAAIQTSRHICPEFLFYYYQLLRNKKILSLMGGTKRMSLNQELIRSIEIPIAPLEEQERICQIISSVGILVQKQQERRSVIQNLKNGLMQKLLTGKIRVKA